MRRWIAVPLYGALFAPLYLILAELGAWFLAGIVAGAALGLLARRWRR
jgi:hypothetical protein